MDETTNPKDRIAHLKTPLDLIPSSAKHHAAWAFADGSAKYGKFNWRHTPVRGSVYLGATLRHIDAYNDGEDYAADSGCHHLGHAIASIGILLDAMECGTLIDDRPDSGCAAHLHTSFTPGTPGPPAANVEDIPRKVRVYIAGPMTGYEKFNFPAFDAARDLAIEMGYDAISPADIDRRFGVNEYTPTDAVQGAEKSREFARRDCDAILSLRSERGDAIAMLPNWRRSRGARAEFFLACWLGLTVWDATDMQPMSVSVDMPERANETED